MNNEKNTKNAKQSFLLHLDLFQYFLQNLTLRDETGQAQMGETQIVAPLNSTFRPTSDSGSFSYVQTGMATTNVPPWMSPWLKCNGSKVVVHSRSTRK